MSQPSRYSRQTVLDKIGKKGQRRLLSSRITVVGLGALGSVISTLLARAGIGHLRIIDRDVVELVNLHRQLLYDESQIGMPKATAAANTLRQANSSIEVEDLAKDLNHANVLNLIRGSDLVMDGTDNLETRFLLNDACLEANIPWIYGGAIGTEGRVMTIVPGKTACFRCFNRHPPAPGLLPTCETAGVLNSAAAATASLQVSEAVKFLLGESPSGQLVVLDGWSPEMMSIRVGRRKDCPACGAGKREYLAGSKSQVIAALCGRDTISFDPLHKGEVDLKALAKHLKKIAEVKVRGQVLVFQVGSIHVTLFNDGRALIKGIDSPDMARSIYSKYIGL